MFNSGGNLVILDRDGVINQEIAQPILTPEQWQPIEGSIAAIASLARSGVRVVIATNQAIIAKQQITVEQLQQIHNKMLGLVREQGGDIDQILYCPHQDKDGCVCRKPQAGMLNQIAEKYQLDFSKQIVPFVGDAERDLIAAKKCGALPVLVLTGKGQQTKALLQNSSYGNFSGLLVFDDLNHFVQEWLSKAPQFFTNDLAKK